MALVVFMSAGLVSCEADSSEASLYETVKATDGDDIPVERRSTDGDDIPVERRN